MGAVELARLRYRCRRGMLELDALLERFTHSAAFELLSVEQRKALDQLLDEADPQLLSWLMQTEVCHDPAKRQLINLILKKE